MNTVPAPIVRRGDMYSFASHVGVYLLFSFQFIAGGLVREYELEHSEKYIFLPERKRKEMCIQGLNCGADKNGPLVCVHFFFGSGDIYIPGWRPPQQIAVTRPLYELQHPNRKRVVCKQIY